MSPSLDIVDDETPVRRPLSTEQFADLRRGQDIRDRQGRIWNVTGDAYPDGREWRAVLRSGDVVRVERQRFADDYSVVESPELRLPALAV
jgi:hypothetical protein